MKKLIPPIGPSFGILFVALIIFAAQGLVHTIIKGAGAEVLVDNTCKVQDIVTKDKTNSNKVILELDCQGQKATTHDVEVLVSYFKNPGPLTCTVYESGKAECQPRKQVAETTSP